MTSCPSTSCAPLQSSCLRGLSVDAQCIGAIAGHPHTLERNDCSSGGSRVAAGERNSRHFHPMTFWRLHNRIRVAVYSTSTSLPRDLRARSNVINFKPATAVKANMYASAQTFGERLGIRARARNSFSISSGSGTKNSIISPDPVPQAPGFQNRFCVHSHDLFGCEKPKNSNLREPTEKELLLSGLLKPGSGCLGMCMPAPQERQPDIGIKEIQRVHRSAHSSGLPVVLWKQSEEIRPALASAAVPARPHVSHREEPVHE